VVGCNYEAYRSRLEKLGSWDNLVIRKRFVVSCEFILVYSCPSLLGIVLC
jgi:hypothetical protein